mmetsp:Transcript_9503/g.11021  ORF Transcript_9503/g.11021 Transcript_9503/m.11021 type:complete len:368 (+) Transcript_9503:169-1272(+)|eukprot:CAMPEP_0197843542 /NCGR_PEP_ID=MMETSP1438-20131217/421_1 /TAXON_ID=1461541 /ORGANISM="Pterosperma sp., Strain CCMP1384" /LENGTH=367 /DNA_ID=CAMNT_0043453741 /DNA_START=160 /DNA_END=1263 /DNA_ORIENTATION=+
MAEAKKVRRVYIRNDAIGEDDLFVPTQDLSTIDNLVDEAIERMKRLGAYLDKEGMKLRTKDGRQLLRTDIIEDTLIDGQVVIATTENAPFLAPHVRMQHPALKDNIRLWVPLDNLVKLEEVRALAELLLQQSDETLKVSQLCKHDGEVLDLTKNWQESVHSGETLYSAEPGGRRRRAQRKKRRDSALFSAALLGNRPSISENEEVSGELSEAMKKHVLLDEGYEGEMVPGAVADIGEEDDDGSDDEDDDDENTLAPESSVERLGIGEEGKPCQQIASVLDTASMQKDEAQEKPKTRKLPSALTYISVRRPSINREKLTYFFTSREELVKRLPGGSWAVFGGDRRISIRGQRRDSNPMIHPPPNTEAS